MIAESELLLTDSGRVYHLNLLPSEVSDKVILVGDPDRVNLIAKQFDTIECDVTHREFHTITGWYKGKRISAMSTGISSDNVDILLTELDALFNVDFTTREIKKELHSLDIVRLGTCGAIQDEIELGDFILSRYSIGLDGMANFYAALEQHRHREIEAAFTEHLSWGSELPYPYVVASTKELADKFLGCTVDGFTACSGGFFAPQGRSVRLQPTIENMVNKVASFRYNNLRITNFEMEGAAVMAMSSMLGHRSTTICVAVAHRKKLAANINYNQRMEELILKTLEVI